MVGCEQYLKGKTSRSIWFMPMIRRVPITMTRRSKGRWATRTRRSKEWWTTRTRLTIGVQWPHSLFTLHVLFPWSLPLFLCLQRAFSLCPSQFVFNCNWNNIQLQLKHSLIAIEATFICKWKKAAATIGKSTAMTGRNTAMTGKHFPEAIKPIMPELSQKTKV